MEDQARRFDFLEGEWDALSRSPRQDGSWQEGAGRLKATRILGGCASLEFYEGPYGEQRIQAVGLRAFNPRSGQWEHTWTDSATPGGFHVWRGRFEGDSIDLCCAWEEDGRSVLSRLTWSRITSRSAHWESHRSTDGGHNWLPHWVIDFSRRT